LGQKSSALAVREPTVDKPPTERLVRDFRRMTRKHHSAKDKIRTVLEGLRG
jgi:transposase